MKTVVMRWQRASATTVRIEGEVPEPAGSHAHKPAAPHKGFARKIEQLFLGGCGEAIKDAPPRSSARANSRFLGNPRVHCRIVSLCLGR